MPRSLRVGLAPTAPPSTRRAVAALLCLVFALTAGWRLATIDRVQAWRVAVHPDYHSHAPMFSPLLNGRPARRIVGPSGEGYWAPEGATWRVFLPEPMAAMGGAWAVKVKYTEQARASALDGVSVLLNGRVYRKGLSAGPSLQFTIPATSLSRAANTLQFRSPRPMTFLSVRVSNYVAAIPPPVSACVVRCATGYARRLDALGLAVLAAGLALAAGFVMLLARKSRQPARATWGVLGLAIPVLSVSLWNLVSPVKLVVGQWTALGLLGLYLGLACCVLLPRQVKAWLLAALKLLWRWIRALLLACLNLARRSSEGEAPTPLPPLTGRDKRFLAFTVGASAMLFAFVFWLGFPGYFQAGDIYCSLGEITDHWHPVIVVKCLQCLYSVFGRRSFYLFALNLLCFYGGLALFVTALYMRTRTAVWCALFLVTAIGNLFFPNFVQYDSVTFPMLLWLGCSMAFFQLLVPVRKAHAAFVLKLLTLVVFLLALLWRHNAILSVYRLSALFVHLHVKRGAARSRGAYAWRFVVLMIAMAGAQVFVVKRHPYLFSDDVCTTTANHIFLHQIAGMVVPANERGFFPREWYRPNKGFEDVKRIYTDHPTFADPMGVPWAPHNSDPRFVIGRLKGLESLWLKAVVAYPGNWLKHVSRFWGEMWFQKPGLVLSAEEIQAGPRHPFHASVASRFPRGEQRVEFSPLRERIYGWLFRHKILFSHIVGIGLGLVVLLASCSLCLMPRRPDADVLVFAAVTSFAACFTAVTVCMFAPKACPRYMSPVLVLSLVGAIGLAAWCALALKRRAARRCGNG